MACSAHVEKGDLVAVSVGVEQRGSDGFWGVGITRGTVLQGSESGKKAKFIVGFFPSLFLKLFKNSVNQSFYILSKNTIS